MTSTENQLSSTAINSTIAPESHIGVPHGSSLNGKVAWIIGGGSGIGLGIAEELARGGATVVISGRREQQLANEVDRLAALGLTVAAVPVDVASTEGVRAAHSRIGAEFGSVDILVSSAGTNVSNRYWSDASPDDFAAIVNINLTGVTRAVHEVLPGMREKADGLIVVISSWAGWRFAPAVGAAYSTSKTALGALVETVNAQERLNGIRATHLCPGEVKTEILKTRPIVPTEAEQELMLVPADVGQLVRYIAEAPGRVCFNEVVITPTSNTSYR